MTNEMICDECYTAPCCCSQGHPTDADLGLSPITGDLLITEWAFTESTILAAIGDDED